jgi:hypothetical protein
MLTGGGEGGGAGMPLCSVFPSTERAHELCTLLGSKSHLKGLGHEID